MHENRMAFTSKADRNATFISQTATNDRVGPGSYLSLGHSDSRAIFAPFGTSTTRDEINLISNDLNSTPGPGTYTNVIPNLSGCRLLPKKKAPFTSEASRFDDKTFLNSDPSQPGPGSYEVKGSISLKNKYDASESNNFRSFALLEDAEGRGMSLHMDKMTGKLQRLRILSAPSIPVVHQSFGYEEDDRGHLIRQPAPSDFMTGTSFDSAGPGHYTRDLNDSDPSVNLSGKKAARAMSFGGFAARKPVVDERSNNPGPGSYVPVRVRRPVKMSASFRSTGRRLVASSSANSADLDLGSDKATPGPGFYDSHIAKQAIKTETKRYDLQFFGSTGARFGSAHHEALLARSVPGPGMYQLHSCFDTRRNQKISIGGGKGSRFSIDANTIQAASQPGPGSYSAPSAFDKASGQLSHSALIGGETNFAFLGSEKRFATASCSGSGQVSSCGPRLGPGCYDIEKYSMTKHVQKSRGLRSNFKSKAARLASDPIVNARLLNPAPGDYDSRLPPKKKDFMKKISKSDGGFLSSAIRESEELKMTEKNALPGPGAYDLSVNTISGPKLGGAYHTLAQELMASDNLNNGLNRLIHTDGGVPAFGIHVKDRFVNPGHSNSTNSVGPGSYGSGLSSLEKKSFNCLFNKDLSKLMTLPSGR